MGVCRDHSTESLGMASSMVTLFRGGVLLGMLLAISGAASPWAGEDGSQLANHQSFLANNGVRSVMKRGAAEVKKKRKSDKKPRGETEEKEKKKKVEKGKKEKNVKKGKNRKGKKGKKGKLKKGKKKKNGKRRNGG